MDREFIKEWLDCGAIMGQDDGTLLVGWGPRTWHTIPQEGIRQVQFYFPDYFLNDTKPWFEHKHSAAVQSSELLSMLQPYGVGTQSIQWENSWQTTFKEALIELKEMFLAGEMSKAVPYIYETANKKMDVGRSLASLIAYSAKSTVHPYGFWDESKGMLGATPEVLFVHSNDNTLKTMACAGTRSVKEDISNLFTDPKELYEHRLVVEGIVESLEPFGHVVTGDLKLLTLPHLAHLVTPIQVKLRSKPSLDEVVRALHPTPAVGAFPKKQGKCWLEAYQKKIDRRRFGAPAGYFLPANKKSGVYVAIRNVQWENSRMYLAAGCGIVPESDFDKEWGEINLKLKAIKEMLAL